MKTRIFIAAFLSCSIVFVALYRGYVLSKIEIAPFTSGKQEEIIVRIPKGTWSYEPSSIALERGEVFILKIINDDDIAHGFAVDIYGVNETIPPHESRTTRPLAATESGTFQFYCSLSCGGGLVATGTYSGTMRGHFDMEGEITVSEFPRGGR